LLEAANGKFTGDILGVHVSGKRMGRKVTFKGKVTTEGRTLKVEASGLLDFSHQALIGKFSFTGTGTFESGKGTMELYALPI
jgi:hypothetical protein